MGCVIQKPFQRASLHHYCFVGHGLASASECQASRDAVLLVDQTGWHLSALRSFPPTSPFSPCRRNPRSSTRSRISGSSCATSGSRTASSNPTTISSTTAARHGTSSSINPGGSCPSDCANGRTGSDQWDSVLLNSFRIVRADSLRGTKEWSSSTRFGSAKVWLAYLG